MRSYLAAVVQMRSMADKRENLRAAETLIRQSADRGAKLVVLPEFFSCLGGAKAIVAAAEEIPGETSQRMAGLAKDLAITLVAGSIPERNESVDRVFNTCLVFGPTGEELLRYRKIHLFDVTIADVVDYRESSFVKAGAEVAVCQTIGGMLGTAICYDLRFPELFRKLSAAKMEVLALPAAFTHATGVDHWEPLLRARAIENQVYVLAAGQQARHTENFVTHGRSMIVDPWGMVLATAQDGEGIALATIDLDALASIRGRFPALSHRVMQ